METLALAITLTDGQTLRAELRPQDERQLAEFFGDRPAVELASSADDLEGHALSGDVAVDVEGHAMVLRLPHAADAAALRRALAAGAITATILGAGALAALNPPAPSATTVEQAPERVQAQAVPGPALRAQRDEMQREQSLELAVPLDADNPAIPAQALRAEPGVAAAARSAQQAVPLDADNPAIPAQALRAQKAELERERALTDDDQ